MALDAKFEMKYPVTVPGRGFSLYDLNADNPGAQFVLANLAAQGASPMMTAQFQETRAEAAAKEERRRADADTRLVLSDIIAQEQAEWLARIDAALEDWRMTASKEVQQRVNALITIAANPKASPQEQHAATTQAVAEVAVNIKGRPEFKERSEQDIIDKAKEIVAGALVKFYQTQQGLKPEQALQKAQALISGLSNQEILQTMQDLERGIQKTYESGLERIAASELSHYDRAVIASKGQAFTEAALKEAVITLNYQLPGSEPYYTPVYKGTHVSADGKTVEVDGTGPTRYFTGGAGGTMSEIPLEYAIASEYDQGAKLAGQIEGSGITWDDLSSKAHNLLKEEFGITDMSGLTEYLRTAETSMYALSILMDDIRFVETVGLYAIEQTIAAETKDGQVFANDPNLPQVMKEKLADNEAYAALQQEKFQLAAEQVTLLGDLHEQREALLAEMGNPVLAPFMRGQIASIDTEIAKLEASLKSDLAEYKAIDAQIEQAAMNQQAAREMNPDFAPVRQAGGGELGYWLDAQKAAAPTVELIESYFDSRPEIKTTPEQTAREAELKEEFNTAANATEPAKAELVAEPGKPTMEDYAKLATTMTASSPA